MCKQMIMLNKTISVKQQYLKPFNYVQTNDNVE